MYRLPSGVQGSARADEAMAAVRAYYSQKGSLVPMVAVMATKCLKPKADGDALPKLTDKTYIVAVVQTPRLNSSGLKAALQILKPSMLHGWDLKQSTRLNCITYVQLLNTPTEGQNFLEIGIQTAGYTGYMKTESRLVIMIDALGDLRLFVVQLYKALVGVEKHTPKLINLDSLLYSTAKSSKAMQGLVLQQSDMDESDPLHMKDNDVSKELAGSMAVVLTPEEEGDLHRLLDQLMTGKGVDLVEFSSNMQAEVDALEQANVHALMSSVELGHEIGQRLQNAIASLDDLDQSLQVFDAKLRHMRDDIASIEARNNRLEVEARNDSKLLEALEDLLQKLDMPQAQEELLGAQPLTMDVLSQVTSAAWDLAERLVQMGDTSVGPLPGSRRLALKPAQAKWLPGMQVVHQTRDKLQRIRQAFDIRAQDFVSRQLDLIAQQTAQAVHLQISTSGLQMPDHSAMRVQLNGLMQLMQVMTVLTAHSLKAIRSKYCTSMYQLLDKELDAYVPVLHRLVVGSAAKAQTDVDTSEFEETQVMPQRAGGFATGTGAQQAPRVDWTLQMGQGAAGGQTSAHRAYKMYLDSFVPFLMQEAMFAADFLQLWEDSGERSGSGIGGQHRSRTNLAPLTEESEGSSSAPKNRRLTTEGVRLIHVMLEGQKHQAEGGVQGATRRFLEMAKVATAAQQPLSIIPMLDSTLSWTDKLRDNHGQSSSSGEQSASAGVLVNAMLECKLSLVRGLNDYLRTWCEGVDKYHASYRVSGAKTVKSLHVLPFVTGLLQAVGSMEELLQESKMINQSHVRTGGRDANRMQATGKGEKGDEEFEDDDSFDEFDAMDGTVAAPVVVGNAALPAAAQIHDARQLVDASYSIMFQHMFEHLEKVASSDPKHGTRLRMENYLAVVQELQKCSSSTPILKMYISTAQSKQHSATSSYVKQQLEYVGFWPLIKLTQDLQRMRDEQTEVALMVPAGQVRETVGLCMKDADKKMQRINERMRKHLVGSSPKLVTLAWTRLCNDLLKHYRQLEAIIQAAYPRNAVKLVPSPDQLAALCTITGQ